MQKNFFKLVFCRRLEGQQWKQEDPDPLARDMDPQIRIRIHTKMSWIRDTAEGVERKVASYPASVLADERSVGKTAKSKMTFKGTVSRDEFGFWWHVC